MPYSVRPSRKTANPTSWVLQSVAVVGLALSGACHADEAGNRSSGRTDSGRTTTEQRWRDDQYEAQSADDGRFVEHYLTRTLTEALSSTPMSSRDVAITPMVGQKPQPLVERSLVRAALVNQARVCDAASASDRDKLCWYLRYGVAELRLDGAEEGITFLWTDRYRRRLRADLILELTTQAGDVVWISPVAVDESETIPSESAKSLENPDVIPRNRIPRNHLPVEGLAVIAVLASFLLLAR